MKLVDKNNFSNTKKKKVSKKKKSSWRKHSCVDEIDQYLEEKRQQERVGVINKDNVVGLFEEDKSQSLRRTRSDKIDILDSHKSPITNIEKLKKQVVDPSKAVVLTRRDLRKSNYKPKTEDNEEIKNETKMSFNIWDKKDSFDEHELYRRQICRIQPVKPPKSKKSKLGAITTQHPGQSYNPSFQQHQSLLKEALDREVTKKKKEMKIYNATTAMFPSKKDAPTQQTWLQEMSHGLDGMVKIISDNKPLKQVKKSNETNKEEDVDKVNNDKTYSLRSKKSIVSKEKNREDEIVSDEESGDNNFQLSNNAPVRRENKKTEKTRRKMEERKVLEEKRLKGKIAKKQMSQAFRVKSLRRQLQQRELKLAAKAQHRLLKREKLEDTPKKLGKRRFEEPAPALKLTEELRGDLRTLKPESHPMKELLHSLQRRNIIPTTPRGTAIKTRKYKPKVFEKKSHKVITAET